MCIECDHIVKKRAILTADAPVERYVVKMSGPSCVYGVWSHSAGESYPHC